LVSLAWWFNASTPISSLGPEEAFRKHDLAVFSNAKNYRRDPLVPLVVPLVNPSHLAVAAYQRRSLSLSKGFIVTNANCSTTALVVPLQALEAAFGPLDLVLVTTMQAISGAGYPGVPSMDIMDNVVPYISGEEEKIEYECAKILGGVLPGDTGFDHHKQDPLRVSATCTRVPVLDGHTEAVSVRFARRPAPSVDDVQKALAAYASPHVEGCPSIPAHPIIFHAAEDRPQPRLDRDYLDGSVVHVGRIRTCNVLDVKFVLLGNNVALGAATSSIMNAEIAISTGLVTV
jgi:aspartate-semialdehyde dehydrogenase